MEQMTIETLEQTARKVCSIARQAGEYIARERQAFQDEQVERKHAHDYVSYVDKGSEQMIVEALHELLPQAGFITEEKTATYRGEPYCWVVDPLDGTTNFIHRYPAYCVSIALCQGHDILIGVVYDVATSQCFYAWKGGGAWYGDERLHVGDHKIGDALLCLQLPYNCDAYRPVIHRLIDCFYGKAASVRMMGSAALALCYVAAGLLDGYVERYIGQWDFMAGALLVKEAGGKVTDFDGNDDFTQGNSVVASNGVIQQELLVALSDE